MTSLDYYAIEELLTDEERAARDRARRFVQEEVMSEIVPCHRAGKFPEHLTARMGALGFFAPYLKEYGGAGLSYTAYGLIMQELERADSGLRSQASVQGALAIYAIHSFGTPEQKARWLPGLVSGERVACFGLTEHGHGSDPGGMETRAKRDGDHYVLNGSKCWIGNASIADVKVDLGEGRRRKRWRIHRGERRAWISRAGYRRKIQSAHVAHIGMLVRELSYSSGKSIAESIGAARAAVVPFTGSRRHRMGRDRRGHRLLRDGARLRQVARTIWSPHRQFPTRAGKTQWMVQEITKAQLLALRLTRIMETGKVRPQQISLAKRNNVWMAMECARKARDILGAVGITDRYSPIRAPYESRSRLHLRRDA